MRNPASWLLGAISSLAFMLLTLPIAVLVLRAFEMQAWQEMPQNGVILDALWLTLRTSAISLVCIVILGTPLAWVLARWQFWGKRFVSVFVELPIVMPPAVAGLALLITFGRRGFLGETLTMFGVRLAFTTTAVIIAQIFVSMPFYIRSAQVGITSIDNELEDAARMDGATGWQVATRITLPLASKAIFAGLILSWARAVGEFGATLLFAGSIQGRTQTMPLLVFSVFERDIDAAIWTGLLLVGMALVALLISQWFLHNQGER